MQKTVGNTISRSVSYLAAPAFAAAMLEHQVLRTIPVGRHVLLIADVVVSAGSELSREPVESVHQTGEVRVIALHRGAAEGADWSPRADYRLGPPRTGSTSWPPGPGWAGCWHEASRDA